MAKSLVAPLFSPPSSFWSRADVRRSLAERDAGALFGLLRRYTGASQQAIGSAVDMAQPHVSAIMSGKRVVTALETWQRIADGLVMPSQARRTLGLADADEEYSAGVSWTDNSVEEGDSWSASRTAQDIVEITLKDLMKRRDAFAAGGALIVGATLTETLEHWLMPRTAAPGRGRGTIGESELCRIEAATVALRHWDDRWRLGIRRKAVIGQLSEVSELVEHPQSASVQTRLFAVMAELSKTVASMSFDSGDHPTAQRYYTLSLRALHQAGPGYRAYGVGVLAAMARQMLDLHRPGDALDICRLALDSADAAGAPPRVRAMLRTREGWSYARMGRPEAYRRTVVQAEDLLAVGGPEERDAQEAPGWTGGFDHAELSGVVGARYRDLAASRDDRGARHRHAESSAAYITQALRSRDPARKRGRAFDLVGLGRTYLLLDEPAESARVVSQAAALESSLDSGRVRRRLGDWYTESAAHHRNPQVAEVRDELSRTLLHHQPDVKGMT
ncbi:MULTISPECIES: helix-turn-helix domain-containing protein [Nocardiopsis]|uniref:Transcriptional regulator n=1 Tax=Nocardiopsis sinuspersici TaxID=501010 RepID=A0A1V3BXZ5_9ACTN|nr:MULTISPECIES: helix-turn-helix domain-containing protein [Nocardiopsis]OOC53318.1 hypothetical protein NOSIN_05410 [Nocardiopsis sinuspersici]